jgi:hypothetical protein
MLILRTLFKSFVALFLLVSLQGSHANANTRDLLAQLKNNDIHCEIDLEVYADEIVNYAISKAVYSGNNPDIAKEHEALPIPPREIAAMREGKSAKIRLKDNGILFKQGDDVTDLVWVFPVNENYGNPLLVAGFSSFAFDDVASDKIVLDGMNPFGSAFVAINYYGPQTPIKVHVYGEALLPGFEEDTLPNLQIFSCGLKENF